MKGIGHLIDGIYEDIAERMIGDIDLIVSPDDQNKVLSILNEDGYQKVSLSTGFPRRHYPRIVKPGCIAAVEVHKYLGQKKYQNEFNYKSLSNNLLRKNSLCMMIYEDQLCLSIIAYQIHDNGQYFNTIHLRNAYDIFLLSQKIDTLEAIQNLRRIFHPLNNFLALCSAVLSYRITFKQNNKATQYLEHFEKIISNKDYRQMNYNNVRNKLKWKRRFRILKCLFLHKSYRLWVIERVTKKAWLKSKLNPF